MSRIFRIRSYLSLLARLSPFLLGRLEENLFKETCSKKSSYKPIFIIGPPRSGSTILYQLLTQNLNCLYIDNLACPFYRNMQFGIWLSRKVFNEKRHNSFDSKYGNTSSLHAPSECQSFWYRWFPKDNDFVDYDDVSVEKIDDMQKVLFSVMNKYESDIVFKNLSCGQRIRVLYKAFPNARFVTIKREPIYTIQSLLMARKKLGLKGDAWWSVKTQNYRSLQKLPLHEKLVSQVYYTEKQIEEDLKVLPEANSIKINYLEFSDRFDELLTFLGGGSRKRVNIENFTFKNKKILSDTEFEELETLIGEYDWGKAGYE